MIRWAVNLFPHVTKIVAKLSSHCLQLLTAQMHKQTIVALVQNSGNLPDAFSKVFPHGGLKREAGREGRGFLSPQTALSIWQLWFASTLIFLFHCLMLSRDGEALPYLPKLPAPASIEETMVGSLSALNGATREVQE